MSRTSRMFAEVYLSDPQFTSRALPHDVYVLPVPVAATPPLSCTSGVETTPPLAVLASPWLTDPDVSRDYRYEFSSVTLGWRCPICGRVDVEKLSWDHEKERVKQQLKTQQKALHDTSSHGAHKTPGSLFANPSVGVLTGVRGRPLKALRERGAAKRRIRERVLVVPPVCSNCVLCPRCAGPVAPPKKISPTSFQDANTASTRHSLCGLRVRLSPRDHQLYCLCPHCYWCSGGVTKLVENKVLHVSSENSATVSRNDADETETKRLLSTMHELPSTRYGTFPSIDALTDYLQMLSAVQLVQKSFPWWSGRVAVMETLKPLWGYLTSSVEEGEWSSHHTDAQWAGREGSSTVGGGVPYAFRLLSFREEDNQEGSVYMRSTPSVPMTAVPKRSHAPGHRTLSQEVWDVFLQLDRLRRNHESAARPRPENPDPTKSDIPSSEDTSRWLSLLVSSPPAVVLDCIRQDLVQRYEATRRKPKELLFQHCSTGDGAATSGEGGAGTLVLPGLPDYCSAVKAKDFGVALRAQVKNWWSDFLMKKQAKNSRKADADLREPPITTRSSCEKLAANQTERGLYMVTQALHVGSSSDSIFTAPGMSVDPEAAVSGTALWKDAEVVWPKSTLDGFLAVTHPLQSVERVGVVHSSQCAAAVDSWKYGLPPAPKQLITGTLCTLAVRTPVSQPLSEPTAAKEGVEPNSGRSDIEAPRWTTPLLSLSKFLLLMEGERDNDVATIRHYWDAKRVQEEAELARSANSPSAPGLLERLGFFARPLHSTEDAESEEPSPLQACRAHLASTSLQLSFAGSPTAASLLPFIETIVMRQQQARQKSPVTEGGGCGESKLLKIAFTNLSGHDIVVQQVELAHVESPLYGSTLDAFRLSGNDAKAHSVVGPTLSLESAVENNGVAERDVPHTPAGGGVRLVPRGGPSAKAGEEAADSVDPLWASPLEATDCLCWSLCHQTKAQGEEAAPRHWKKSHWVGLRVRVLVPLGAELLAGLQLPSKAEDAQCNGAVTSGAMYHELQYGVVLVWEDM